MPTSIAEQVRHLGEVLDDFIVDVNVEEILGRVDSLDNHPDPDAVASEAVTTERRGRGSRRRTLLPAAAVVMIVGLVGSLWVVSGDRDPAPANQPTVSPSTSVGVPSLNPEVLATIPAENLVANAVLRVGVDTPVGRFEIYDHPDAPQTSLYLRRTESVIGGPIDNITIEEGLAWSLIGGEHENSRLAFGLAPDNADYWIEIGGRRIEPDTNGIWYTTVDDNVTSFTIHGPHGPVSIDANPASTIGTTATGPPPTTTTPSGIESPAFAPLVLNEPPDGYTLSSAGYTPGPDSVGIAHYSGPNPDIQLQVINRYGSEFPQRMTEIGRTFYEVNGRIVFLDGEGDGSCLSDVCSVGLQWNEQTFTSITWIGFEGAELEPDMNIESLLQLVPQLIADPAAWTPTGLTER